jgi:hypothetical protein
MGFVVGTIGVVAACWLGPALASSLAIGSGTLGTAASGVARCDTGVVSAFNYSAVSPFPILSVSVSGIASACGGGTLRVTVNTGLTTSSGSGTVPAGGGSMTVTLASSIAARDATQTELSFT